MFVPSKIALIKTLRSDLSITLHEAMRIAERIENEQVERSVSLGQFVPNEEMLAYANRAIAAKAKAKANN